MAKSYIKERARKQVKLKRVIKEKRKERNQNEYKKSKKESRKTQEKRREEKIIPFKREGDFKNGHFKKIGFNSNEKVMDKRPYSNKETLIEVINSKNKRYINKKHENKEYIFLNNFKNEK